MNTKNLKAKAQVWYCQHEVITVTYTYDGKAKMVCFNAEDRSAHYNSRTCREEKLSDVDMDIAAFLLGGTPTISQAKEALNDPVNAKVVAQMRAESAKEGE